MFHAFVRAVPALVLLAQAGCGTPDHTDTAKANLNEMPGCSACRAMGSPPYFEGTAWYTATNADGSRYSRSFSSLRECEAARASDYACTGRPPVSTDH